MLPVSSQEIPVPAGEINLLMEHLDTTPVSAKQVRLWTQHDPVLFDCKVATPLCSARLARTNGN